MTSEELYAERNLCEATHIFFSKNHEDYMGYRVIALVFQTPKNDEGFAIIDSYPSNVGKYANEVKHLTLELHVFPMHINAFIIATDKDMTLCIHELKYDATQLEGMCDPDAHYKGCYAFTTGYVELDQTIIVPGRRPIVFFDEYKIILPKTKY